MINIQLERQFNREEGREGKIIIPLKVIEAISFNDSTLSTQRYTLLQLKAFHEGETRAKESVSVYRLKSVDVRFTRVGSPLPT